MRKKVLGLSDIEDLYWLASELVFQLFMRGACIDEAGKYLNFRECTELKDLGIADVENLTVEEIKEKYLYAALPMARKSFRDDNVLATRMVVGPDVSDDYLDALFCIAWKNDLKIWCVHWHQKAKRPIDRRNELIKRHKEKFSRITLQERMASAEYVKSFFANTHGDKISEKERIKNERRD